MLWGDFLIVQLGQSFYHHTWFSALIGLSLMIPKVFSNLGSSAILPFCKHKYWWNSLGLWQMYYSFKVLFKLALRYSKRWWHTWHWCLVLLCNSEVSVQQELNSLRHNWKVSTHVFSVYLNFSSLLQSKVFKDFLRCWNLLMCRRWT